MDLTWMDLCRAIVEVCLIPLLGVLTKYLISFISAKIAQVKQKTNSEKLNNLLSNAEAIICDCVTATTQTYVEALKDKDVFDADAQRKAFQLTYNTVLALLTNEMKQAITDNIGDLDLYLTQKIEALVNYQKN